MAKNIHVSAVVDNFMVGTATVDKIMLAGDIVWENMVFICAKVYDSGNIATDFTVLSGTETSSNELTATAYEGSGTATCANAPAIVNSLDPFGDGSLLAKYQFNNNGDDTRGVYDGTPANMSYTTGLDTLGQCGVFNGTSSVVDINAYSETMMGSAKTFSVSSFVKFDTIGAGGLAQCIISLGGITNGWSFGIDSLGNIMAGGASGTTASNIVSSVVAVPGVWYHIGVTRDQGTTNMEIYIDGVFDVQGSVTFGDGSNPDAIGGGVATAMTATASASYVDGEIDQVEIYNKVLSAAEMFELYEQSLGEPFTTLYSDASEELFEADYELTNISSGSTTDTLSTGCPIANGDNLIIAKDDDSIHEMIAAGVIRDNFQVMNAVYSTVSASDTNMDAPEAVLYNNDGTKIVISSNGNNGFYQYSCATPYSIVGMIYDSVYIAGGNADQGVVWAQGGTKFLVANNVDDRIDEYDCPTAYDITGMTLSSNTFALTSVSPRGMTISLDETKIFITDLDDVAITQYNMMVPGDISTMTKGSNAANSPDAQNLQFNETGTVLVVVDQINNCIYQYSLGTAWDISTMNTTITATLDISGVSSDPHGLAISPYGDKMLITDKTADTIYEYDLPVNFQMDTTAITTGEVPSRVFVDAGAEFDIGSGVGYQTAVKNGDVYTLGATLQTTQSYDNITDAASATLDTKITLKNIGDKMTKLSFSASK